MKHIILIGLFSAALTACKKSVNDCQDADRFCAFVNKEDFNGTGPISDAFLKSLQPNLSEADQLLQFKDWLTCKPCVTKAEIICVSCIETLPVKSELEVTFTVGNNRYVKTLDLNMTKPITFGNYHD